MRSFYNGMTTAAALGMFYGIMACEQNPFAGSVLAAFCLGTLVAIREAASVRGHRKPHRKTN